MKENMLSPHTPLTPDCLYKRIILLRSGSLNFKFPYIAGVPAAQLSIHDMEALINGTKLVGIIVT